MGNKYPTMPTPLDTKAVLDALEMERSKIMNSGSAQRDLEIPELMTHLGERLSTLEKELDTLASRLVPAMSGERVMECKAVAEIGKTYGCDIAKDLDSKLDLVDNAISRITSIVDRLEL